MKIRFTLLATALVAPAAAGVAAHAQAVATATLPVQISAFAGVTGAYTGLESSRNVSITAGLDVGVRSFFGVSPALELRGTYPIADGRLVAQRNVLGGVRLGKRYSIARPYVDILFGRGQLDFLQGGYPNATGTFVYNQTTSNVISPGLGLDVDLLHHLGAKVDFQYQRYPTPAVASGNIYAKPLTFGIVYRLGF